jgi:hypothetical protein
MAIEFSFDFVERVLKIIFFFFFPLALLPAVGFDLSNNTSLFLPIYQHRGKQWQPTPKNLPRLQGARAIPVA